MIQSFLKKSNFIFKSQIVFQKEKFVKALVNFSPDVILSDHQLPQFDSFDALKILKEKNLRIPFILATGTVSEEFAAIIIKEGADDYVLKNNLTRLPNAINSAIEKRRSETQIENSRMQLENKIQELNNLIYRISHDLKAPLASTSGLISIARKEIKEKNAMQFFDMIEKTNKKMQNVLMSFNEIVRISQEKFAGEKNQIEKIYRRNNTESEEYSRC